MVRIAAKFCKGVAFRKRLPARRGASVRPNKLFTVFMDKRRSEHELENNVSAFRVADEPVPPFHAMGLSVALNVKEKIGSTAISIRTRTSWILQGLAIRRAVLSSRS